MQGQILKNVFQGMLKPPLLHGGGGRIGAQIALLQTGKIYHFLKIHRLQQKNPQKLYEKMGDWRLKQLYILF